MNAGGNFYFFFLFFLDLNMSVLPPKLRVYRVSLG